VQVCVRIHLCACVGHSIFSSCYNYVALQLQWNVTYKNLFVIVLFVMKNCFFELFVLWWSLWCLLLVADKDSQYKHEKISFDPYNISLCFLTSQKQLDFFFKLSVKILRFKYMNIISLMFFPVVCTLLYSEAQIK
jgi:hypothetical protein